MPKESTYVTLPAAWANFLVRGNFTGLTESEYRDACAARNLLMQLGYAITATEGESEYTEKYGMYHPTSRDTAGFVLDYKIERRVRRLVNVDA